MNELLSKLYSRHFSAADSKVMLAQSIYREESFSHCHSTLPEAAHHFVPRQVTHLGAVASDAGPCMDSTDIGTTTTTPSSEKMSQITPKIVKFIPGNKITTEARK